MTRQPHIARRAEELLGSAVAATAPVAGGDIATATRLRLSSGRSAFVKTLHQRPGRVLRGRGRRAALAGRGRRRPGPGGARGRARLPDPALDRARASSPPRRRPTSAAPWRRRTTPARRRTASTATASSASCRCPTRRAPTWAEFYATRRVLPYLKLARDRGAITPEGAETVEGIVGQLPDLVPEEGPRRHPRRPLERQRRLDPRRRLLRDRPRRARRPPRDRPGDARAVRPAAPAAGLGRLRGGLTARRRLGGPRRAAPAAPAARARRLFGGGYGARAAEVAARYA